MNKRFLMGLTILGTVATAASAQNMQRRATMMGGGSPDRGKCTIQVVVDGGAEVEIRGDTATLRDLNGQMPQWRRFECSGMMPRNPADFRFVGVDGRGTQRLVSDPGNGGAAVVRIEDPEGGAQAYTFEITWGGSNPPYGADRADRGDRRRFSPDDATRSCQDAVRQQAAERFRGREIVFRRIEANDNPGRRDSVSGFFDLRRDDGRDESFHFSCSANLDTGRVWNATMERIQRDRGSDR